MRLTNILLATLVVVVAPIGIEAHNKNQGYNRCMAQRAKYYSIHNERVIAHNQRQCLDGNVDF